MFENNKKEDVNPLILQGHNPMLDGLRAIAILLVMLVHTTNYHGRDSVEPLWEKLYLTVVMLGWSGVDLFFVLSGFLITGILLNKKDEEHYFRNFFARRTLRIFPLYYLLVILALFIGPRYPFPMPVVHVFTGYVPVYEKFFYLLYISNILELFSSRNVFWLFHCWSLAIEEQFYLVWPWIVFYSSKKTLTRVCIYLILSANIVRCIYAFSDPEHYAWITYHLTYTRWDTLACGALIAIAANNPKAAHNLIRFALPALLLLFSVLFVVAFRTTLSLPPGALAEQLEMITPAWNQILIYPILAFFFSALIIYSLSTNNMLVKKFLSHSIMVWLGKHSYGIYIWHWPIFWFSYNYLPQPNTIRDNWLIQLGLFPFTFFCAYLSMELFEKHFLKLKKYFEATPK
ncbi:MAG: acyltransferase family protein [Sumerlaeia bacterium]